jgi:8-oxo-dGTP pyrophosphatase MutT (NUDIX family)
MVKPKPPLYRSKVLIIPYVKEKGDILFLLVKDRKHAEWTFISGTCRKRCMEHPIQCATRELKEETKEIIDIDLNTWPHRHVVIDTTYYEPDPNCSVPEKKIMTTYHIYFVNMTDYPLSSREVVEAFAASGKKGKHFNENSDIDFCTLDMFSKINFWKFITHVVFNDDQFNDIIHSL